MLIPGLVACLSWPMALEQRDPAIDLFGDYLPPPRATRFGSLAVVDVVVASLLLALASPVIAVAAIAIKLSAPGITCLWQVGGRNHVDFHEWVKLDLESIDTWSLTNDFKILLRTIRPSCAAPGCSRRERPTTAPSLC